MTVYRKTMADAYREMYPLNEDNMDKMRKAAKGAMQTIKFKDGKLHVDSFTASGLMQIYDKVNPKNKAAMEKIINHGGKQQILKLQSFAMKKLSGEATKFIRGEEVEVDEATLKVKRTSQGKAHHDQVYGPSGKIKLKGGKSATGYDLYHKTFSAAMQHSYAFAKKKFGITIDPNEIDQKVASGPKKPSSGKTNRYGLKGDKGGIQVQVYNTGKNYELNMYKEEVDLNESTEKDILIALKKERIGGYFSGGKLYVAQRALETVRDILRGMKLTSMPKLVGEEGQAWAGEELIEGAWQLPVGPKGRAGLKKLLQKPVKAKDAIDAIDPYIGDDELWDDIGELDDKDPNQDARPLIRAAMKRLKIKEDMEVYGNAISKLVSEHKGKKPHKHPHPEGGPLATVDEAKVTKKEIDRLENDNEHGLVALKLVQAFGTPDEVKKVKEINKRHEKRGHITRQDQQDRTSLSGKYYRKVKEDLDEAVRYSAPTKDGKNTFQVIDRGTKGMRGKQDQYKMVVVDKKGKEVKDWGSHVTVDGAVMFAKNKKIIEEVELDEKVGYALVVQQKDGSREIVAKGSKGAMKSAAKKHGGLKQGKTFLTLTAKEIGDKVLGIGEELTEKKETAQYTDGGSEKITVTVDNMRKVNIDNVITKNLRPGWKKVEKKSGGVGRTIYDEVDLDEGKMKELHMYIQQKKSAEWIAKKMSLDVKTVKQLMPEETVLERVDRFLESARSDAMKAMRGDPDLKNIKGKDDDDETATDDDIKAASKNIIAQMRKVVSLRGKFKVEFLDGKKEKIDPKIAQAIQKKYNSMRRPADKEKFQAKISKSKKDLLNALKESLHEADAPSAADAARETIEKRKKSEKDEKEDQKEKEEIALKKKKREAAVEKQQKPIELKHQANKDKAAVEAGQRKDTASAQQAAGEKEGAASNVKARAKEKQEREKREADAAANRTVTASYNPILSRIDEKIQERKNG